MTKKTKKARTQPEYIEGKNYTWVYDYKGDLVKYWHASHVIHKISTEEVN